MTAPAAEGTHTEARDWLARELRRHGLKTEAVTAIMGAADTYAARAAAYATQAERERCFLALTACEDCGKPHEPHTTVGEDFNGKPVMQTNWASRVDGHAYRPRLRDHRQAVELLRQDQP